MAATERMPVGSVISFAGEIKSEMVNRLYRMGWLICDGSKLKIADYPDLFQAIGNAHGGDNNYFYVPDMQSKFIRGVNGDAVSPSGTLMDPDSAQRASAKAGGNAGNDVGSYQDFATGLPKAGFYTNVSGSHTHNLPHLPDGSHNAYAGSIGRDGGKEAGDDTRTGEAGAHSHDIIVGGDPETRPKNMNLHFLIKFSKDSK